MTCLRRISAVTPGPPYLIAGQTWRIKNGVLGITTYTYDAAGRLTQLVNRTSTGTMISSFDYTYDKVGNRTGVVESNNDRVTWSHDNTYQLTREQRSGGNSYDVTNTYDTVGNRTVKTDSGNRTTYIWRVHGSSVSTNTAEDPSVIIHSAMTVYTPYMATVGFTHAYTSAFEYVPGWGANWVSISTQVFARVEGNMAYLNSGAATAAGTINGLYLFHTKYVDAQWECREA